MTYGYTSEERQSDTFLSVRTGTSVSVSIDKPILVPWMSSVTMF